MNNAGIKENLADYEFDILNKTHWKRMSLEDRRPLCYFLEQIYELGVSAQDGRLPSWIEDHIISTNAAMGRPMESIIDLYRRYGNECSNFIEKAVERQCPWAA